MASYAEEMRPFLEAASETTFAVGGIAESIYIPEVSVEGVGALPFPLPARQAAELKALSTLAPFGREAETLTDPEVRLAWQVAAQKVTLGTELVADVQALARKVSCSMNINPDQCSVEARLYKLLLYESGGHFTPHRDTEKEPGMFGTLVIQLPSEHTGGDLVVSLGRETKRFSHHATSRNRVCYTAFYADCVHELEPVTSGVRLALVFSLILLNDQSSSSSSSSSDPTARQLFDAGISSRPDFCGAISRLVRRDIALCVRYVRLEHAYSIGGLSYSHLKGRDRTVVDALISLRDRQNKNRPLLEAHLVLVEKLSCTVEGYKDVITSAGEANCPGSPPRAAINLMVVHTDVLGDPIFPSTMDPLWKRSMETGNEGALPHQKYMTTVVAFWHRRFSIDMSLMTHDETVMPYLKWVDSDERMPCFQRIAQKDLRVAKEMVSSNHAVSREIEFSCRFSSNYTNLALVKDAIDFLLPPQAHLALYIIFSRHGLPLEIERAIMGFAMDMKTVKHVWSNILTRDYIRYHADVDMISKLCFLIGHLPLSLHAPFVNEILQITKWEGYHDKLGCVLESFKYLQLPLLAMRSYSPTMLWLKANYFRREYPEAPPNFMFPAVVEDALKWFAVDGGIFHAYCSANQTPELVDGLLKSGCNAWRLIERDGWQDRRGEVRCPSVFLVWAARARDCLEWARQNASGSRELIDKLQAKLMELHTDVCKCVNFCRCAK